MSLATRMVKITQDDIEDKSLQVNYVDPHLILLINEIKPTPWWITITGILAGAIILGIISYILYKVSCIK